MAVIVHAAGVPRCQLVGTRKPRHHRDLAGDGYAVVALAVDIDEPMVSAMQMQSVRHVMAVLERDPHPITLLDTDCRRR